MDRLKSIALLVLAAVAAGTAGGVRAEAVGAKLFSQHCAACHAVAPDAPMGMGPNLHGVLGREAGKVAGFPYSNEFLAALAGKSWTAELLDRWLEQPQNVAKGTYMMYQQPDPEIRRSIIEYLQTVK